MFSILLAQKIYNPALTEEIRELEGISFLNKFLPNIITFFLVLAAVIAFFYLLLGGIRWITSEGDKEKIDQAKRTVTSAIIGLVLVFALWAILQLLENIFGINLLIIDLGPIMLE